MSVAGKWGYSRDGEFYFGFFETREEALAEADTREARYIGRFRDPVAPENCIDADALIEAVLCHDDYCGEWAEGALVCSKEQLAELTASVGRAFGEWIDRHGLRPRFGIVGDPEEILDVQTEETEDDEP